MTRLKTIAAGLALSALVATAALAQPRAGGTLNWVVNPAPTALVPLTTSAGGNTDIGPKIVEGLLTYDYDLKPKPLLATAWTLGAAHGMPLDTPVLWALAAVSALLVWKTQIHMLWLIAAGAALGAWGWL